MLTSVVQLFAKEVIEVTTAKRLGQISDVELNCESGCAEALLVQGDAGFSLKKPPVYRVLWKDICVIGETTVLINRYETKPNEPTKKSFLRLFSK